MAPQIPHPNLKYDELQVPYVDLGKAIIRLEREDPPAEALEKAKRELRETPEIREAALNELRELVTKEDNLHLPTTEEYLLVILRPVHFYPQSGIKRIRTFYNMCKKHENYFNNVYPQPLRHVFEQDILTLMPKRDQHGRRILLIQLQNWKPSKVSLKDLFKAVQLFVLASMIEPLCQINGAVVIIDVEGLSLNQIMQFSPSFAGMLLEWIQDCLLTRLKAVHIVNNSKLFNMLFSIFKPFIREKLRNRIHFHGKDMKSLTSHVDENVLTPQYGGNLDVALPPGYLLADLFNCYTKDFEMANNFGFTK